MPLINCEINLIFTWSDKCALSNDTNATKFAISDTKIYVPDVILSTQNNAKLIEQLKSGFKRTTNWSKYEAKVTTKTPNPYLDFLTEPRFQGVNRIFVLSFENKEDRRVHTKNQPVQNNLRTHENIRKIVTGQGDYYCTGCLLDYNYFSKYYEMIAIDLSKQRALAAGPKAMQ